mmetsp:Transcript_79205/g.154915  ORF Transcript_79205/g.154915 Transcript_79205/m.154915 type:complete len:96 (+) Transcript_79205:570-857(+)
MWVSIPTCTECIDACGKIGPTTENTTSPRSMFRAAIGFTPREPSAPGWEGSSTMVYILADWVDIARLNVADKAKGILWTRTKETVEAKRRDILFW